MAFLDASGNIVITDEGVLNHAGFHEASSSVLADTVTKLITTSGRPDQGFGYSVSAGSGRIVVGAYLDDDKGSDSGSAYIYDLDGNLITKLTAFDGAAYDYFGWSVSVGSGRIVVGARLDDDKGTNSGSAYVYDLDGNLVTKLTAFDGVASDVFGFSVAVGSGRIVVGAQLDDDKGIDSGSAYIYDLDGNLITKLTAFDGAASDYFGYSVAVGSGRIVVGLNPQNIFDYPPPVYTYDLGENYDVYIERIIALK